VAGGGPDPDLRVGSGVRWQQQVFGELDDDPQGVDPAEKVDARVAERRCLLGADLRQRALDRCAIRDDAEELFEVDEEWIVKQTGLQLNTW
jgi:hypothetical protein